MRRSVYTSNRVRLGLAPATIATNTTTSGLTVDLNSSSQFFKTAMLAFRTGTVTDGSYLVTMEESPNDSDWTAVAAADIQGSISAITSSGGSDKIYELGYVGSMRYVRCKVVSSATTSGAAVAAVWVLGQPSSSPITHTP
jgi:hypothetical protein